MKFFFYTLIFAVTTLLFAESSVIPRKTKDDDACARIYNEYKKSNDDPEFSAKYSDLKECFESFPYDKEMAERVSYAQIFYPAIGTYDCFFL